MSYPRPPIAERLMAGIEYDTNGGCWLWSAGLWNGYGRLSVGNKAKKANRLMWEMVNGPIPAGSGYHGTCLCHRCDVKVCINPEHMFLGTAKDNTQDAASKGIMPRGIRAPKARLTEQQVREIRASAARQVDLAALYGVNQTTISSIKCGKSWGWLA